MYLSLPKNIGKQYWFMKLGDSGLSQNFYRPYGRVQACTLSLPLILLFETHNSIAAALVLFKEFKGLQVVFYWNDSIDARRD